MPAPYYDEETQCYYLCSGYGDNPKNLLKFDKELNWETVKEGVLYNYI